ncbi:cystathionine gamma-synthase family protein [Paraglaciecola aquimarina]|uniref:Cystathionine gamma-synthase family protein n=1 Tax=Paraglaciecola aquimarina TaxID=1235557 RepID=A0ABU3SZB4_9ALTE|nr:cystathionine gamma-synthase family protein [Paraglaciecola aquimarina]MDU0355363.1 cystathionine gamma-synthase family protein [Paraglaciecola aquimarina]
MKNKGFTTRLVHADRLLNNPEHGAVHQATNNSVLFEFKEAQGIVDVFQGKQMGHVYGRSSSGSAAALQNILNHLEGGVGAVTFATGMAAITAVMMSLFKAGDHIIVSHFLFGNTRSLAETLESLGIELTFVDVTDVQNVKQACRANTKAVYLETIANPVTQVADLRAIGQYSQENSLLFIVDSTMTPPNVFDAKSVFASLTVSSLTKYMSGHGNVLGGSVVDTGLFDWSTFDNILDIYRGADSTLWGLTQIRKRGLRDMGATLSPEAAHDISIGLETLVLRTDKMNDNAMCLANYLQNHEKVSSVYYPGLAAHPQHYLAREHFSGYGGILSFDLLDGIDPIAFLNALELVICATHLGDTRTLALPVASTIYFETSAEQRVEMGINDNMIRMSIGIEDKGDLVADFEQAFSRF